MIIFNKTIGLIRWIASTNHKDIGTLYFLFGILSGFLGGLLGLVIRTELRSPGPTFISERAYNVVISSHGLIIFYFFMPVLIGGFGNLLLPFILGCADMAFPRLINLSFWLLPPRIRLLIFRRLVETGVRIGWILYPPLSSLIGHQRIGIDLGIFRIHIAGASSIGGSINFFLVQLETYDLLKLLEKIFPFCTRSFLQLFWSIIYLFLLEVLPCFLAIVISIHLFCSQGWWWSCFVCSFILIFRTSWSNYFSSSEFWNCMASYYGIDKQRTFWVFRNSLCYCKNWNF